MLLLLDNYDSFTYNLAQYLGELGQSVEVRRNDEVSVADVEKMAPHRIVISPGPCTPDKAGVSLALVTRFAGEIPILGVCLGHQTIGQACGGRIVAADRIMHGKVSKVFHDERGLFEGVENPFEATRYHSLVVERESLPAVFEVSAKTWDDEIMALRHRDYCDGAAPLVGVQFHPESIKTQAGKKLLANFINISGGA